MTPTHLLLALVIAAPVPKVRPTTPVVRVELARDTIHAGEPVFLAVSLTNHSRADLRLKRWFDLGVNEGDVVCELRRPGETDFRRVKADEPEIVLSDCAPRRNPPPDFVLPAGETERVHTFLTSRDSTHAEPGKYQIRYRVIGRDSEMTSEPVEFTVRAGEGARSDSLNALEKYRYLAPLFPAQPNEVAKLEKALAGLDGSVVGTVLTNRLLCHQLRSATTPNEWNAALKAIERHRDLLGDVERELLDLGVCGVLVTDKRGLAEAEERMQRVQRPSVELDRIRMRLVERTRSVR